MKHAPITESTEAADLLLDFKSAPLSKTEYFEGAVLWTGSNDVIVHLCLPLLRQTDSHNLRSPDPEEEKR